MVRALASHQCGPGKASLIYTLYKFTKFYFVFNHATLFPVKMLQKMFFFIPCQGTGFYLLEESFSPGDFKTLRTKATKPATETTAPVAEEAQANVSVDSDHEEGVYSCPQEGCVRVFQRLSALEKHLSLEKCCKSLERHSLMDLAKMGYKSYLEQRVGTLPSLRASTRQQEIPELPFKEGWGLKAAKKTLLQR